LTETNYAAELTPPCVVSGFVSSRPSSVEDCDFDLPLADRS
jgi:hypothetical protein